MLRYLLAITTLQQLWLSGNSWQGEYESQQPLNQNETMCTNITFGLPFDADKYEDALRGLNLSSSHRTRVAIACAVYQDVGIYLLEAVLSAVDSHVGTNIFKACLKESLKGKLVLLVAHSLSFVSHCDQVAVIADETIIEQRSFKKLMMVSNSENEEDKEDMTSAGCLENNLALSSDER
ncbi:hypothetical protein PInf_017115 [Phytophthora infestans]|nr:hypothetical protein PInf_017115 [Phytophthora infestans]